MSNHDDALVEAVATTIRKHVEPVGSYSGLYYRLPRADTYKLATAAIEAVRAHDAGLPCGHCSADDDEIRCGCKIGEDALMSCPNCEGSGLYDDCTCSVCEGDGELTERQWKGHVG